MGCINVGEEVHQALLPQKQWEGGKLCFSVRHFHKDITQKSIRKGFIVNKTIDKLTYIYPDLSAIIKTYKQKITKEEEDMYIKKIPMLFNVMD